VGHQKLTFPKAAPFIAGARPIHPFSYKCDILWLVSFNMSTVMIDNGPAPVVLEGAA